MKTKLIFTALLSFTFYLLSSQVPQGVNYQAIARDMSGNPIGGATIDVKMGIQSDTNTTVFVREELFASVKTNVFGLFTLVLGTGTYQTGSTFNFSDIDWTTKPLYLKTQIFYGGNWKYMGSAKLWAVPYSLIAKNLGGTVSKIKVKGTETDMDSALFEVRNKNGQIVFAVYNEAVRIYVDDGLAGKGTKGGFAIGSFNKAKGPSQNLLIVRPDTFRIFFDDTPGKGTKGGFAVGGFGTAKGPGLEYLGVKGTTPEIIVPSQAKILWYPLKEAFLTGRVRIASPDSVGTNSLASGFESRANGNYSQALGFKAIANGIYSTSIGKYSYSGAPNSFAFGERARATGDGSYAFGSNAIASGAQSVAIGSVGKDSTGAFTQATKATAFGSFAAGYGSVASGQGAFAFGVNDTASGPYSTTLGYATVASLWYNTAMGVKCHSGGWLGSTATGWQTTVEFWGAGAMANGVLTKAGDWAAAAFGDRTYASGHTSFATGYKTTASGHLSATFGDNTAASGDGAAAMGHFTTAQAYGSLVIGRYNTLGGNSSAWNFWDPAFAVGNGNSTSDRSNAFTVYNSGIADLGWFINLNSKAPTNEFQAIKVNNTEALWYNGTYFSWGYGASYNYFRGPLTIGDASSPSYTLNVNGDINCTGTYYNNSDARWKTNLKPLEDVTPAISLLQGYRFNWRTEDFPEMNFDETTQIGLIAQDVEKIFPELVRTDNKGYKSLSYEKLSVLLLQGMKEQQMQIESQKMENIALRSELNSLREEIEQIKSMVAQNR